MPWSSLCIAKHRRAIWRLAFFVVELRREAGRVGGRVGHTWAADRRAHRVARMLCAAPSFAQPLPRPLALARNRRGRETRLSVTRVRLCPPRSIHEGCPRILRRVLAAENARNGSGEPPAGSTRAGVPWRCPSHGAARWRSRPPLGCVRRSPATHSWPLAGLKKIRRERARATGTRRKGYPWLTT